MTGTELKSLRQSMGLSQAEMAERLFITQGAYSMMENKDGDIPARYLNMITGTKERSDRDKLHALVEVMSEEDAELVGSIMKRLSKNRKG